MSIFGDLLEFVSMTEQYLDNKSLLYERRTDDMSYIYRKGRKLLWDIGAVYILNNAGINDKLIGDLVTHLARGAEEAARETLEQLREAIKCLTE